jgi:4-oxalocrotonate tautomerase
MVKIKWTKHALEELDDIAKKIISGITKVFVDLGVPLKVVEVIIQEIPKSRWGIDGKPAT